MCICGILALAVACLSRLQVALGAVHVYQQEDFLPISDAYILKGGHEGMFRSRQYAEGSVVTPKREGTNDGKSFIKLAGLSFRRPEEAIANYTKDEGFTGLVEVVVFEKSQKDLIGYATEDDWQYCCDEEQAKKTKCQPHHLYIAPTNQSATLATAAVEGADAEAGIAPGVEADANATATMSFLPTIEPVLNSSAEFAGFPWRAEIDFLNADLSTQPLLEDTLSIKQAGVYVMWFVVCDPELADVVAKGETVWKNPKGYLPGARQALLPFHASISFLYTILSITWLSLHLLNSSHVFAQQNLITLCVALGMLEACIDYADVYGVNRLGRPSYALSAVAIIAACAFKTCLRLTMLLLARGFGTLRPTGFDRDILFFSVCYFVASIAYDFKLLRNSHDDDPLLKATLSYQLPVVALEALLTTSIVLALRSSLRQLSSKGESLRLNLLRFFACCIAVMGLICTGYLVFEAHFHITHPKYDKWQYEWMHATFWHLIHFICVAMLCILWAPGEIVSMFYDHPCRVRDYEDGEAKDARESTASHHGDSHSVVVRPGKNL